MKRTGNTPFKGINNGISLGAIAGGPASSREREKERDNSETFSTFNMNSYSSLSQPARNRAINPGSHATVWENPLMGDSGGMAKGRRVVTRA